MTVKNAFNSRKGGIGTGAGILHHNSKTEKIPRKDKKKEYKKKRPEKPCRK